MGLNLYLFFVFYFRVGISSTLEGVMGTLEIMMLGNLKLDAALYG